MKRQTLLILIGVNALLIAALGLLALYAIGDYSVSVESASPIAGSSATARTSGLVECKTLSYSGNGAIGIVFFAGKDDAKAYTDYLLSTPPLGEHKNNFNIFYIDSYTPPCESYKEIATLCYSKEIIKKAAACPYDYIVALVSAGNLRSSSYKEVMSVNTDQNEKNLLIHEFGHSFANLAEEYIPGKIPRGSQNCQQKCENFNGLNDGCFKECSDTSHSRSIDNGIMRTLANRNYGRFNEFLIEQEIEKQIGQGAGLTGNAIADIEITRCASQNYLLAQIDPTSKSLIGRVEKNTGCAPGLETTIDAGLIFTDKNNGGRAEIDGETFENVDVPIILVNPNVEEKTEYEFVDEKGEIAKTIEIDGGAAVDLTISRTESSKIAVGAEVIIQKTKGILTDISEIGGATATPQLTNRKTFIDKLTNSQNTESPISNTASQQEVQPVQEDETTATVESDEEKTTSPSKDSSLTGKVISEELGGRIGIGLFAIMIILVVYFGWKFRQ